VPRSATCARLAQATHKAIPAARSVSPESTRLARGHPLASAAAWTSSQRPLAATAMAAVS
jgi:hypothetical protein